MPLKSGRTFPGVYPERECLKIEDRYDIPSSTVLRQAQHKSGGYGIVVTASKTTIPYPHAPTSLSDDGILF